MKKYTVEFTRRELIAIEALLGEVGREHDPQSAFAEGFNKALSLAPFKPITIQQAEAIIRRLQKACPE